MINHRKKLLSRTKSVLIPYIIWNIIAYISLLLVKILGVLVYNNPIENIHTFLSLPNIFYSIFGHPNNTFGWHPIDSPLWFIRDLYVLFLLIPLIINALNLLKNILMITITSVFILSIWDGFPMFQIQSLFFYTLGLYLKLYNIEILPFLCKYRHLFIITAILSFALRYISGSREFMPIFIISASGLIFYFSSLIQKLSISEQIKSAKKYSFLFMHYTCF